MLFPLYGNPRASSGESPDLSYGVFVHPTNHNHATTLHPHGRVQTARRRTSTRRVFGRRQAGRAGPAVAGLRGAPPLPVGYRTRPVGAAHAGGKASASRPYGHPRLPNVPAAGWESCCPWGACSGPGAPALGTAYPAALVCPPSMIMKSEHCHHDPKSNVVVGAPYAIVITSGAAHSRSVAPESTAPQDTAYCFGCL